MIWSRRPSRSKITRKTKMRHKAKIFAVLAIGLFAVLPLVLAQPTDNSAGNGAAAESGENLYGQGGEILDMTGYGQAIEALMKAPTGKMTDEIYVEITARLAVCHKGTMVTDEVFNHLKDPYDVTAPEYAAFTYQNMERYMEEIDAAESDPAGGWIKKYEARKAELEANGCVFNTTPDGEIKSPCMDADGDDPDREGEVYYYGETARAGNEHYVCEPCRYADACRGDFVVEQICRDGKPADVEHRCEFGCFAGRCLAREESQKQLCEGQCLENCPAGTMDFGAGGCPKKDGQKNVCCQKVFGKPEASGTCAGSCMKSSVCPEGYENKGTDSCVQEENCYKCGLFNLFTCCDYTKNVCCVPKTDAPLPAPAKCNGYCTAGACAAGSFAKGTADCAPARTCLPCGFFGLKKCCEYQSTICCEYPEPVTDCSGGICTYDECPSGTVDVGIANCGKEKKCKTACWGFCKKCDKKQTRCCMAVGGEKCDRGTCQESGTCPVGYKSIGAADCGSYEKEYACGFLGMSKCKDPAAKTCCVPE